MQTPVTVTFVPTKLVAVIRRCAKCGAVVARTFRSGKPGRFASPHTCPPPPAASMALAA